MGEYFWRKMLFWLFALELVELPLSWKKVRGGLSVQWIGYQLQGGVTGRTLKSALGRLNFVAEALQHVRPFLGPLFAWSAASGQGTFARFPDAAVLLDFVGEEVSREPICMARPRPGR